MEACEFSGDLTGGGWPGRAEEQLMTPRMPHTGEAENNGE